MSELVSESEEFLPWLEEIVNLFSKNAFHFYAAVKIVSVCQLVFRLHEHYHYKY